MLGASHMLGQMEKTIYTLKEELTYTLMQMF